MTQLARGALETRVTVLLRELADGSVLGAPLADLSIASHGSEAAVLAELASVLRDHLSASPAERVARMTAILLPEEVEEGRATPAARSTATLARIDVPLTWRAGDEGPSEVLDVSFDVVLVAESRASEGAEMAHWAIVPALAHTFWLDAGEPLEGRAQSEIRRMVGVHEGGLSILGLLPPETTRLVSLPLELARDERGSAAVRNADARARDERMSRELAERHLREIGRRVVAAEGELVGRERELADLRAMLRAPSRLSVLVTGPEGAGKTALLERGAADAGRPVYAISPARLLAAGAFGGWQAQVELVFGAAERLDAILVFDDLSALVDDRPESPVDLASAILPYLDDKRVRVLGEVRGDVLDRVRGRHLTLVSAFQPLRIEPLSPEQTVSALVLRAAERGDTERAPLAADAAQAIVDLAHRYLPHRGLPGEAMHIWEELVASFEEPRDEHGRYRALETSDVHRSFARRTGMPAALLRADLPLARSEIEAFFAERLIGQREAVRAVADTLCVVKAALAPPARPLATFLFVGPTGVGKTEVARVLSRWAFGSEDALARFDMSEYADPLAADRLLRGTDHDDGLLTRRVREQPFTLLLLDEIEKAHPSVHDLLLQVLGEGRLSDARGRTAHFHNCVVVMTSNLGATDSRARSGFGATDVPPEEHYLRAVEHAFRPELRNRLDRIVPFHPLSEGDVREVSTLALARVSRRHGLGRRAASLEIGAAAAALLAARGTTPSDGARALRRVIEDELVAPVARALALLGADGARVGIGVRALSEEAPSGAYLTEMRSASVIVRAQRGRARGASGAAGLARLFERRRLVERVLATDPPTDTRERIERLVASIARAASKPRTERRIAEQTTLTTQLAGLSRAWDPVAALHRDLHAVEDLALTAFADEQSTSELEAEGERIERAILAALLDVFCVDEPFRHHAELEVVADDDPSVVALERWVVGLCESAEARGWRLSGHLPRPLVTSPPEWPTRLAWSAPQPAEVIAERVRKKPLVPRCVRLDVRGERAGTLLAAELGRHELVTSRTRMAIGVFRPEGAVDAETTGFRGRGTVAALPLVRRHVPEREIVELLHGDLVHALETRDVFADLEIVATLARAIPHLATEDEVDAS